MEDHYLVYNGKAVAILPADSPEELVEITLKAIREHYERSDLFTPIEKYSVASEPPTGPHNWAVPGVPFPDKPHPDGWLLVRKKFSLDCFETPIEGYKLNAHPWNGWAMPAFELEPFIAWYIKESLNFKFTVSFQAESDDRRRFFVVRFWNMEDEEPEEYEAREYMTVDGPKWLIAVGAGCWCWNEEE